MFTEGEAVKNASGAERQSKWRADNSLAYKSRRAAYRHDNSKWETDASYLQKPFVVWDGEGITLADGSHLYVMLSVLKPSGHEQIIDVEGLPTKACFDFLLDHSDVARGIHVIYGGGYDFNMMFRDLTRDELLQVYGGGFVNWNGYRLMWRKGKSFYLARLDVLGGVSERITLYDCAPFFQVPFISACDSYLGDKFVKRDLIVKNKALRSSFHASDIPEVTEYTRAELENLLELMNELRKRLNKCGLRPRRWDGPGAVASVLLKREGVQKHMAESPAGPAEAARYAYAGGRFEVLRFGTVKERAYEYDVNSAYPHALLNVPSLANGKWIHHKTDPGNLPFALYHVAYSGTRPELPGAFFQRAANGTICYPLSVTGWYWSPEAAVGRKYCAKGNGKMRVLEVWEFKEDSPVRPFAFISRLYRMRQVYKAQGDGAHVGIKLGLNSLYGKLAQQVGARVYKGVWKIPPFHQLEWAGYVTSHCRAAVLNACLDDLDAVIAFETDAVFVSRPLIIPVGTDLGEFDYTEFSRLTYVQSGLYFGESDGKMIEKTRGVDRGSLHESEVIKAMGLPRADDRYINARLTRFVGAGIALAQNFARWRRWETAKKRIGLEPSGKRAHIGCDCVGIGVEAGRWHYTICPIFSTLHSAQFPIEWINPDPAMKELEELRDARPNWE